MYKELKCARCGVNLEFIKQTSLDIHRGNTRIDALKELFYLPVDIYLCPECGEYHFIKTQPCEKEKLVKCKWCCKMVDPDYPCCPVCGHKPGDQW
ncbi:MAG: hypothetical protein IKU42_01760 [Oscillospiraceae bacterium]|nr:hypothetical protein [Oscillospiraceae bacterium]